MMMANTIFGLINQNKPSSMTNRKVIHLAKKNSKQTSLDNIIILTAKKERPDTVKRMHASGFHTSKYSKRQSKSSHQAREFFRTRP